MKCWNIVNSHWIVSEKYPSLHATVILPPGSQNPRSDGRDQRSDGRVLRSGTGDAAARTSAEAGPHGKVNSFSAASSHMRARGRCWCMNAVAKQIHFDSSRHHTMAIGVAVDILGCTGSVEERASTLNRIILVAQELKDEVGDLFAFTAMMKALDFQQVTKIQKQGNNHLVIVLT